MTSSEQFPERPQIEAVLPHEKRRGFWVFTKPFIYHSKLGDGIIPVGFETDFASVPKAARNVVDDDDPMILCPSMRHDHRYATQAVTRKEADEELRDGILACGGGQIKAFLVYNAVRLFGGSHWKSP